jgi:hypothetical protein
MIKRYVLDIVSQIAMKTLIKNKKRIIKIRKFTLMYNGIPFSLFLLKNKARSISRLVLLLIIMQQFCCFQQENRLLFVILNLP